MNGEVNHAERGRLVRAMNAATEASAGLMYAIAALIVIFGVIVVPSRSASRTTEDRAMQNGFYEVRVPDATDYWMEMVKCRHACPVHTDACGYVTAIAEGRYEDAYRIARAHNPSPPSAGASAARPAKPTAAAAMWMRRSPSAR